MSSKNAYRLVNPITFNMGQSGGTGLAGVDSVVRASNFFSAGKKLYSSLSSHFTNHVEGFNMSVQNLVTKKLAHFKITETRGNNGQVDYNLVKLGGNMPEDIEEKLIEAVEAEMERAGHPSQSGGKRKKYRSLNIDDDDSSSSSESSSDDYYGVPVQPISRFVYFHLPYYKIRTVGISPLDAGRLYLPMFSLPVNPSLEVRLNITY